MIVLWIAAACVLSAVLFRKHDIPFPHYVWLFMPIDTYGIDIGGSLIKPYMIFVLIILVMSVRKLKSWRFPMGLIVVSLLLVAGMFTTDILNGLVQASLLQHLLFALVLGLGLIFTASTSRSEIETILCACSLAAVAFGLIFVVAAVAFNLGVTGYGISADLRSDPGMMFLREDSVDGVYTAAYRLRGFFTDPNSLITMFCLPLSYAFARIFWQSGRGWKISVRMAVAVILVSVLCVFFSNSRVGFLVVVVLALLVIIVGWRKHGSVGIAAVVGLLLVLAFLFWVSFGNTSSVGAAIAGFFGNRSSFTDYYGRGTIWTSNLSQLINGPLWVGFGQNQIQYYSEMSRACHNTWLEFVCGDGLIVGLIAILFFLFPIVSCLRRGVCRASKANPWYQSCRIIFMAYIGILVALSFVDFTSNTYLIFTALILYVMVSEPNADESIAQEDREKLPAKEGKHAGRHAHRASK